MGKSKGPGPLARAKRFVVVSDTHGDMIDRDAERAFREFVKVWKPEIRIHAGDVFDFRPWSRHATEKDLDISVADDFESGLDFLEWFRPQIITWGNHDHRLTKRMTTSMNGNEREWCRNWVESINERTAFAVKLPWCKRRGVAKIGNYSVVHGYSCGADACQKHANAFGNVFFGHTHQVATNPVTSLSRREAKNIGCLCRLDMDYNRGSLNTLRQAHGWAYGYVLASQELVVWQAEKVAGLWVVPSEMKLVG